MISLRSMALALARSHLAKLQQEQDRLAYQRRKAEQRARQEAAWKAEQERRLVDALDIDGSRARARAERDKLIDAARRAEIAELTERQRQREEDFRRREEAARPKVIEWVPPEIAAKRREQAEREKAWREELDRRRLAELDLDGSQARARAERERELEERRLAEMTAMLIRQTR